MDRRFTIAMTLVAALTVSAGSLTAQTIPGKRAQAKSQVAAGANKKMDLEAVRTTQLAPSAAAHAINAKLLAIAARVHIGQANCEFKQTVSLSAVRSTPGYFNLSFKSQHYTMVPEETTTGAVRLVDRRSGMLWVQIPAKSMLLNQKTGQRVVDECKHAAQLARAGAV
ncbi:MAG: hypothetical protein OEM00_03760 [Burkholderiaceae bacterium]|nr:hypothetical protein [Burkholderiaceae bacterium]MDH3460090.1 hypothetical protein [Burkholderiaceae bacterium]